MGVPEVRIGVGGVGIAVGGNVRHFRIRHIDGGDRLLATVGELGIFTG